jgi:hypothetical protein
LEGESFGIGRRDYGEACGRVLYFIHRVSKPKEVGMEEARACSSWRRWVLRVLEGREYDQEVWSE